ncbi:MAG: hypothetical protein NVS4B1_33400 [Ktedonobacteraceae bacterium]
MRMFKVKPNKDTPQLEGINLNAASATGTGADYEHPMIALPNLGQGAPTNTAGAVAQNAMTIRWMLLEFEAVVTGVATNNVTYNLLQRRLGLLLVNAVTSATTIVAGTQAVVPSSMANIYVNSKLVLSGGTGATETVTVASTTATSFTATFVNGHSGAYAINSAPLATTTFGAGTNAVAYQPIQLAVNAGNVILGGDSVSIQRLTNGTGIATPALSVWVDWINTGTF